MAKLVDDVVSRLRADPSLYPIAKPHPRAAELVLPDGTPAPKSIRTWAAFDERYPAPSSAHRSDVRIADPKGRLIVKTMKAVFQWVCVDSIRDELEDDPDTLRYVKDVAAELTERWSGHGVLLDPDTQPDCILWLGPTSKPRATLLWYEDDAVERRQPFDEAIRDLFSGL